MNTSAIINSLINKSRKYKTLIQNFNHLTALNALNVLIPILVYPYLIRILGSNNFGIIIFSQSIANYFIVFVNFGFEVSGTKQIAENRSLNYVSKKFFAVSIIKILLIFLAIFLVWVLLQIKTFNELTISIIWISVVQIIFELFLPVWFFLGLEKVKYISYSIFISRIIYFISIFIFIKNNNHLIIVPVINLIGKFIGSIYCSYILIKKVRIIFTFPSVKEILNTFTDSFYFFLSRVSTVMLSETNIFIIGTFLNFSAVAYYDIIKKITNLFILPFSILNQTIFPSISKSKDILFVKKIIKTSIILSLIIYISIFPLGKFYLRLLGGVEMIQAFKYLKLFALQIPILALSFFLGNTVLVVLNYNKEFNFSVIFPVLFYIISIIIIYWFYTFSLQLLIILLLSVSFMTLIIRIFYIKKNNLIS